MDLAPTANPHAKLVTGCVEEGPALEISARNWLTTTPPELKLVKGSGPGGIRESAVFKGKDHSRESKFADVFLGEGCEEGSMPPSSRVWLPGLAGHGGDLISQGQQTSVVEDTSKLNLVGGCTLPSLKDLGLDRYVDKRI